MSGKIKRHVFRGTLMTASEIARQHALSLPTVMRRLRARPPLTDDQLVAPPHTLDRGLGAKYTSDRELTINEARYHLKRAMAARGKRALHYANAMLARDPQDVLLRLKLLMDKADQTISYWRERVRMIENKFDPDAGKTTRRVPGRRGWVEP